METVVENTGRRYQQYCVLPQRYLVAIMTALGLGLAYNIRITLSIVIRNIAKPSNNTATISSDFCRFNTTPLRSDSSFTNRQYDWDKEALLTARILFFVGYFMGHVPGGYLADRYTSKHVFGSAVLAPAILNAVVPVTIEQTGSWVAIASLRLLIGLVEGMVIPTMCSILSRWTPVRDRGRLICISLSATQFSLFINNIFIFPIIMKTDWTYVVYFHSGICVLWLALWNVLCYSSPSENPWISIKEEEYLRKELDGHVFYGRKNVPWCKILSSRPVWVFVFVHFTHSWVWNALSYDLPLYMRTVLRYNIKESLSKASLPYAAMGTCTVLEGFLSDFLINRGYVKRKTVRKILTTIGSMGPPVFLLGASFSGCHRSIAVAMFTIAMILMASYYVGTIMVGFDLAPNYTGIVIALANGSGALTGILEPMLAATLTPHRTIYEWRNLFLVVMAWAVLSNLIFIIFGTAREQPWNLDYKQSTVM